MRAPALVSNLEGKEIRFPILTYNNVLLETRNEQNIVYLPQYGLNTLDQAACTNWESLGYLVKPCRRLCDKCHVRRFSAMLHKSAAERLKIKKSKESAESGILLSLPNLSIDTAGPS